MSTSLPPIGKPMEPAPRPKALSVLREAEQDMRIWLAEEIEEAMKSLDDWGHPGWLEAERGRTLREVRDKLVELGLISGTS